MFYDSQKIKERKTSIPAVRSQDGASALLSIFGTALLLFSLGVTIHVSSVIEYKNSDRHYASVSSFYAAESCSEEAMLHLGDDASYNSPYTAGSPLAVGQSLCHMSVTQDPANPRNGQVVAYGMCNKSLRQVYADYQDAGPNESIQETGTGSGTGGNNEGSGSSISDGPLSLMLVLDRSASMGYDNDGLVTVTGGYAFDETSGTYVWDNSLSGYQPISDAKNAAIRMILNLDPEKHKVGFVSYSTLAIPEAQFSDSYNTVISKIKAMMPFSHTNTGGAIKTAVEQFGEDGNSHYIILLTDGKANKPTPGTLEYFGAPAWVDNDPKNYALWQAELAHEAGISIYTISLGADADQVLMQDIADHTGGTHHIAPTSDELDNIFTEIHDQIINVSHNLKKTSWQEK